MPGRSVVSAFVGVFIHVVDVIELYLILLLLILLMALLFLLQLTEVKQYWIKSSEIMYF